MTAGSQNDAITLASLGASKKAKSLLRKAIPMGDAFSERIMTSRSG